MTTVTKQDFLAYEDVRTSGVTNMWDARTVEELSGLDRATQATIRKNYEELAKEYLKENRT